MKYYIPTQIIYDFIRIEENVTKHPGGVFSTENEAWATRVNAKEISKEEAQERINNYFQQEYNKYDKRYNVEGHPKSGSVVLKSHILP